MKNKRTFFTIFTILFFSLSIFSQVSINFQNLQYTNNGQPTISVANCGNIDLATSTSTSVNFGVNLKKPNGQVVGLSDLYVYTQKSPSDYRVQRSRNQIQESFWNHPSSGDDTFSVSQSLTINSSDFNVSGGTLFVVFKLSSNVEYQSCSFTITKTPVPSFSLSPSSLNIPCGDTSPRTFTVTPSNIPAGATVTYNWICPGWSGTISPTMNSVSLRPNSPTSLPSSVSVTPFINGVAQSTPACIVSRANFLTSASIIGNSVACPNTTNIYTINGVAAGNTVAWSSTNTAVATVSGGTNTQVTVNALSVGSTNLIATITNLCGQIVQRSLTIQVGAPTNLQSNYITGGYDNVSIGSTSSFSINPVSGATSYQWNVIPLDLNDGIIYNCRPATITGSGTSATVNWGTCVRKYEVNVQAINACGPKGVDYKIVNVFGNSGGGNPCIGTLQVSPNPVKTGNVFVNVIYPPCDNSLNARVAISNTVDIYDFQGNKVYTYQYSTREINIDNLKLPKGKYIINVTTEKGESIRKVLIVE